MKRVFLVFIILNLFLGASPALGQKALKKKKKRPAPVSLKQTKTIPEVTASDSKWYVLASLGAGYWKGFSFFSDLGVLYLPEPKSHFGWGLDNQLLMISKGALFTINAAVWYRLSSGNFFDEGIQLGAFLGPTFSSSEEESGTTLAATGELLWNKRIDEMVFLRIFLRSGWIHNGFLAQAGANFVFDFQ